MRHFRCPLEEFLEGPYAARVSLFPANCRRCERNCSRSRRGLNAGAAAGLAAALSV